MVMVMDMDMVMDTIMDMGVTGLMDMDTAMDSCMDYPEDMEAVMGMDIMEGFLTLGRHEAYSSGQAQ